MPGTDSLYFPVWTTPVPGTPFRPWKMLMLQMTDAIEAWFSLIWAGKATFEKTDCPVRRGRVAHQGNDHRRPNHVLLYVVQIAFDRQDRSIVGRLTCRSYDDEIQCLTRNARITWHTRVSPSPSSRLSWLAPRLLTKRMRLIRIDRPSSDVPWSVPVTRERRGPDEQI